MSNYITQVKIISSNYAAQPDDQYIGCLTQQNMINITLANISGVIEGSSITIKDDGGNASVNPIVITCAGGALIDNQRYQLINVNFGALTLIKRGAGYAISSGLDANSSNTSGQILSYTTAELPSAVGNPKIVKLLDSNKGLLYSNSVTWQDVPEGHIYNVQDFGAKGDGVTDDSGAINLAITSMPFNGGAQLYIPPGTYRLSQPIDIVRAVIMYADGDASGETTLVPDAGVTAIVVHYSDDETDGVSNPDGGYGGGSIIRDIFINGYENQISAWNANTTTSIGALKIPTTGSHYYLECTAVTGDAKTGNVEPSWTTSPPDGIVGTTITDNNVTWTYRCQTAIWLRAPATIRNVKIMFIAGDAIQVMANTADTPPTNANCSTIDTVFIHTCNGSGLFIVGGDTNAGNFKGVNANNYKMWGVWDASFLGNTHSGHQAASEVIGAGGYHSSNLNSRSIFLGCYSESIPSRIIDPAQMIGGIASDTITADTNGLVLNANIVKTSMQFSNISNTPNMSMYIGNLGSNAILSMVPSGGDLPYRLKFNTLATGWWSLNHSNSDGYDPIAWSSDSATCGAGQLWIPNGTYLGRDGQSINFKDAIPVTGAHVIGDWIFNQTTSVGSPLGFRCTSAGTPGTWETIYGNDAQTPFPSSLVPSGTTQTIDWSTGMNQNLSLTNASGTVSVTLTNPVNGGRYTILITQGPNNKNVTWPVSVKWSNGTSPVITATSGKVDQIQFIYDGTSYYGTYSQNY